MKSNITLIILLTFFVTATITSSAQNPEKKPNIIFFLIDDLGWMDLSCQGSEIYETPKIDKLASESMIFSNAYAAHPRCVPSRFGLMTGKYPAMSGVPANRSKLEPKEKTFAQFFKQAGYYSCYIGKWHLGENINAPDGKCFDLSIAAGNAGSPRTYFAPFNRIGNKPWNQKKSPIPNVENALEGAYLNDYLTTEAINFIDMHKQSPFFLMIAHYAVHEPLEAPQNLVENYNRKIASSTFHNTDEYIKEGTGRTKMKQNNATYAAMLDNLDKNIGRILDYLDKNNLSENTIIIFTSDHGGLSNDGINTRNLATSNYPLRAGKGWLYEGGIRVPLFVKWPGLTSPSKDSTTIITGIDFYPTIAEIITGEKVKSDGISFMSILTGEKKQDRGPVFWYSPKARPKSTGDSNSIAVRYNDYKLLKWYETGRIELYNLNNDIGEQKDLSKEMPDKKKEMEDILNKWASGIALPKKKNKREIHE